jgi:uncharacterized damage-inducible protein DinB
MADSPLPQLGLPESIERLASMPEFVLAAIEVTPPDALARQPAPGEFSLVEHACHLRDLEREGYLARIRRMMSEARPDLAGFDGAAVAAQRDYRAQDARAAARDFEAARRELAELLGELTEDDLRREGTFCGEPVTLGGVVAMMVEHDRGHRDEIARLMDFLEE